MCSSDLDLAAAETSLAEAESAFSGGQFKDAVAKAEVVQQSVQGVKMAIEEAIAARGGRRAT